VLLVVCSALVATACVVASGRRLAWAIAPWGLEPRLILQALESGSDSEIRRRLQRALAADERFVREAELFAAFDEDDEQVRSARVSEQLIELDERTQRWARLPRVCASIATSAGMMLACVALVQSLAVPAWEASPSDESVHAIADGGAMSSALAALALGIAATSFCVAVHVRAARVCRERRVAIDQLVERLDRSRGLREQAGSST
jgi:hypothetical protein